ncbi:MAG TPA: RNA polymerase sigma factor [Stellaceae bacterium]
MSGSRMSITEAARSEDDLVARARAHDELAIRALIQRHNQRLYRIARGILRDDFEAEDALQEGYLKAFSHLDDFAGNAAIGTWLCRIVMNEALGRLRQRRPTVEWNSMEDAGMPSAEIVRFSTDGSRPDPERALAQRQIRGLLEQAIDRLPEDFRIVLIARVVEEMSIQETAALLDIRPETVKTRLHRARVLLRRTIEAQIGPMATEVFPFEDPRCRRTADIVIGRLAAATR